MYDEWSNLYENLINLIYSYFIFTTSLFLPIRLAEILITIALMRNLTGLICITIALERYNLFCFNVNDIATVINSLYGYTAIIADYVI